MNLIGGEGSRIPKRQYPCLIHGGQDRLSLPVPIGNHKPGFREGINGKEGAVGETCSCKYIGRIDGYFQIFGNGAKGTLPLSGIGFAVGCYKEVFRKRDLRKIINRTRLNGIYPSLFDQGLIDPPTGS